jgi:hypothetical protein
MLADREKLNAWRENCRKAAHELNWAKESKKLIHIYSGLIDS